MVNKYVPVVNPSLSISNMCLQSLFHRSVDSASKLILCTTVFAVESFSNGACQYMYFLPILTRCFISKPSSFFFLIPGEQSGRNKEPCSKSTNSGTIRLCIEGFAIRLVMHRALCTVSRRSQERVLLQDARSLFWTSLVVLWVYKMGGFARRMFFQILFNQAGFLADLCILLV